MPENVQDGWLFSGTRIFYSDRMRILLTDLRFEPTVLVMLSSEAVGTKQFLLLLEIESISLLSALPRFALSGWWLLGTQ